MVEAVMVGAVPAVMVEAVMVEAVMGEAAAEIRFPQRRTLTEVTSLAQLCTMLVRSSFDAR